MNALPPAFVQALAGAVGPDNLLTDAADCWPYGGDNSRKHAPPGAVVLAAQAAQISAVVTLCHQHRVPLTARGRGTGTTGGAIPGAGAVVVSLERLDRILRLDAGDRLAVVEAGVTNQAVQEAAARHGLFWPPDPSSAAYCTVGGNLAVNAAGPHAVKYGTVRDNVLGLRAVTGTGEEVRTGCQTTKGVVGYDLTRLLIGSEGTLAIITEANLKLLPCPDTVRTLQATYATLDAACAAVVRIMGQPSPPCVLEFIDANALEMIRQYSPAELPRGVGALLMIEVDGTRDGIEAALAEVRAAAQDAQLLTLVTARDAEHAAALWAMRKALSPALRTLAPGKLNEDVVVPVSRIPELIRRLDELADQFRIPIVNFGHAGNGNIHVNLLFDPQDVSQQRRAHQCLDAVFDTVLELGGTLSGEHGIGTEKRNYIDREIDPPTLALMRRIKDVFDPRGILNPGKMFPPD